MKVKILASKQVGDVSYLVGDLEILYNVVKDEIILGSKNLRRIPEPVNRKITYRYPEITPLLR